MCGLVGALSFEAPLAPQLLRPALAALSHRGPDGEGRWRHPSGRVLLGHRRLAIVGLKNGAQPLASEDGQVVAVVNGEFYEHERLRASLSARGHSFRTDSDSEVLIHLYEERGLEALSELRGEFAFLLWDERRG